MNNRFPRNFSSLQPYPGNGHKDSGPPPGSKSLRQDGPGGGDSDMWPSIYMELVRERVRAARAANGFLVEDEDLMRRIFPFVHSLRDHLCPAGISRWLWRHTVVRFSEKQVHSALRRADGYWPSLWAEVRVPLLTLACVHGVRMDVILWTPGAFHALPGWSPGMTVCTARGSFRVAREGYEDMHRLLLRRWLVLTPHTHDRARSYMGQVVQILHDDYGLPS